MARRNIYYGETFGGTEGIVIGDCVYSNCLPLVAIERYCDDETHNIDINDYDWYLNGELIWDSENV